MRLCVPAVDGNGNYDRVKGVSVGDGLDGLQPGDSRLVFAVAVEKGPSIRRKALGTGVIDVYSASGREYRAKNLGNVPRKVIGHYTGLPGWDDAMDACYSAFEANGTL